MRVPRAWGAGGDAMAEAAALALPWPEAATIEEPTLDEQIAAIARELPPGRSCSEAAAARTSAQCAELARRHGRLGVVWIDAHGDLNTPESSPSGNAWGMPLRMLIDAGVVAARDVTLLGARNLDPPEADFIRRTGIREELGELPERVYVALDCDVFEPGHVDVFMPEPGGPSPESLELGPRVDPGAGGAGLTASSGRSEPKRSCPGSRMHSASEWGCNRLVTGWGLSSRHVRGPDRRPGRAQERSTARPEQASRTPARGAGRTTATTSWRPRCGCAATAATTSRWARGRGSTGTPILGSFVEEAADVRSEDPLDFFDLRPYAERLAEAELNTGLGEAAVIGHATMDGHPASSSVMDFTFMGGSMGSAVGEKFSRACDSAIERGVPLVSVTSSGGARMQEGILSLMQLPKTVCAVEDLHDAHIPMFTSWRTRRQPPACSRRSRRSATSRSPSRGR